MQQHPVETSISIHAHTVTSPEYNRSDRGDNLKHSISISTIKAPPPDVRVALDDEIMYDKSMCLTMTQTNIHFFLDSFFPYSDNDHVLITQTDSIEDSMIESVEEIIEENPRHSPSIIVISVSLFFFGIENILFSIKCDLNISNVFLG